MFYFQSRVTHGWKKKQHGIKLKAYKLITFVVEQIRGRLFKHASMEEKNVKIIPSLNIHVHAILHTWNWEMFKKLSFKI